MRKVVRDQERKFARIRQRIVEAKPIFGRDSRVKRNLVPISKCVTRFEREAAFTSLFGKVLHLVLDTNSETGWQPHLNLLAENLTRQAVTKANAFVSSFQFEAERRKHVRLRQCGDAAMR